MVGNYAHFAQNHSLMFLTFQPFQIKCKIEHTVRLLQLFFHYLNNWLCLLHQKKFQFVQPEFHEQIQFQEFTFALQKSSGGINSQRPKVT